MARIRTIKPEFFRHEGLFQAEQETGLPLRLAFIGLLTTCDREGRFKWRPKELKLDCLPYDDIDFSRVLDAWATRGFVVKYESDGNFYGYVPGFTRHQAINHREAASTLPNPLNCNTVLTRDARVIDASARVPGMPVHTRGEGKGREGKGKGREGDAHAAHATPAVSASQTPIELKKQIWGSAVGFLKTHSIGERQARSLVGLWRKTYSDIDILNAMVAAEAAASPDPVAYITKTLSNGASKNGNPRQSGNSQFADLVAAARREQERAAGAVPVNEE